MTLAAGMLPAFASAAAPAQLAPVQTPAAGALESTKGTHYRAVSWWLTWPDLTWPNDDLMDKIRRRADRCAGSGVNCCIIFGTHYRWDFLPVWGRLHDMFHFIADELHQRRIVLFDHHSSVLTHRPRTREGALKIWHENRHAVPFYPSLEAAAEWQYNGTRLNDWRMVDIETGQPVYVAAYDAEQFCMNNPAFRAAYTRYVRQLVKDTGIDGLMSDDGIYYAGWKVCGCQYCRERFQKTYGHTLPPVSDTSFWGNRDNEAFKDWIDMRFQSAGDHLAAVQQALPAGFPFLSCCSGSDGAWMPACGMTYQDFIRSCNLVFLEMVGSTPSVKGTWDDRVSSQLLHLSIARDHRVPCIGLGYGFYPDTAFFIWALNKFLGSDSWLSSLKGRLDGTPAELDALADDSEVVQEGYQWEKAHPQLFNGAVDTEIAVLFSRSTRDHYGQCDADYANDYEAACLDLLRAGISYDVATEIPQPGSRRQLVLSSVACLSADERRQLARFLEGGGTVIATGPTGHYDERARRVRQTWLEEFGARVELLEPQRPGSFPPGKNLGRSVEVARCRVPDAVQKQMRDGWFSVARHGGRLLWRPERFGGAGVAAAVVAQLEAAARPAIALKGLPADWRVRRYRDGNRWLIHAIPAQVGTLLHPKLANHISHERVIQELRYTALTGTLTVEAATPLQRVVLHSPDLTGPRAASQSGGKAWSIDPAGLKRYFVVECIA